MQSQNFNNLIVETIKFYKGKKTNLICVKENTLNYNYNATKMSYLIIIM